MRIRLLLFLLFFICFAGFSQYVPKIETLNCGQSLADATFLRNYPEKKALQENLENARVADVTNKNLLDKGISRNTLQSVVLPVVVHIIHNNGSENISDAQVLAGIQYLNQAFANVGYYDPSIGADTKIQFCLAKRDPQGSTTTGITRNVSSYTNMSGANGVLTDDLNVKNLNRWDPKCYINVWLVNSIPGDVAGYAYLPSAHGTAVDGLVCKANYMGSSQANNVVLIHEMGHYLGLLHTFEGACKNDNCLTDGDRVCDTPPDSFIFASCNPNTNSCSTDADDTSPNNPFRNDVPDIGEDYMDYAPLSCGKIFTQGQAERMHFFIDNVRASLLTCLSCVTPCNSPVTASITTPVAVTTILQGTAISFTGMASNASTYSWFVNSDPPFASTLSSNYVFTMAGAFWIKFRASSSNPNFCTPVTDSVRVIVKMPIVADFNYADGCVNQNIKFTNTSTGDGNIFNWDFGDPSSQNNTSTLESPMHAFASAGNYSVRISVSNGLVTDTKTHIVTVAGVPPLPTVTTSQPTCSNASGKITVTNSLTGVFYSFNNGMSYQASNISGGLPSGNYQVVIKSALGCGTSATLPVTILPQPSINNLPTVVSPRITYNLNEQSFPLQAGGVNLLWYTSATGGIGNGVAPTPSTANVGATIFYVSQNQGCGESQRVPITVEVIESAGCWSYVGAGNDFTVALKNDGSIWSWGANDQGQLGVGTQVQSLIPIQVGTNINWRKIAVGGFHTVAIRNDGSLWGWGWNNYGQLGDGTIIDRHSPVRIGIENNWKEISAGGQFVIAIKTDGSAWSWGLNDEGQLGLGFNHLDDPNPNPVQIGIQTGWEKIQAGHRHALAIKIDGSLWSWGDNHELQLGLGGPPYLDRSNVPKRVGTENNWINIGASFRASYAIKNNHSLWAWGKNEFGELGNSNVGTYSQLPLQIGADLDWEYVGYAGAAFVHAIKTNGSLWGWGYNAIGELGDGTTIDKTEPTKIGNSNNWRQVVDKENHAAAITLDGTLFTWGENNQGQNGTGNTINSIIPVEVVCSAPTQVIAANFTVLTSCALTPTSFTNISTGNITGYFWDFGDLASGLNNTSSLQNPSHTYQSSGNYTVTLTVTNGTISNTITYAILISAAEHTNLQVTICEGGNYFGHNTSGTYTDTYTTLNGCDSIRKVSLQVLPTQRITIDKQICSGDTYLGYNASGVYVDLFTGAAGCDSIRTLRLTVLPKIETIIDTTICHGLSYFGHTTAGSFIDHFTNAQGCDSMRTVHLQINTPPTSINLGSDFAICSNTVVVLHAGPGFVSYQWQDIYQDSTYSVFSPGVYHVAATNSCGFVARDTIVVSSKSAPPFSIGPTIEKCKFDTISLSAPAGFTSYTWSGYRMSSTVGQSITVSPNVDTTYIVTAQSGLYCTVRDTIKVLSKDTFNYSESKAICAGTSYQGYTTSGIYIDHFSSQNGCDSVRTLHLIVNPAVQTVLNKTICEGESYLGYTTAGTYSTSYTSAQGCDSVRIVRLTVIPTQTTTIQISICQGETYLGYSAAGTYSDIFKNTQGCDSVRILQLQVVPSTRLSFNILDSICLNAIPPNLPDTSIEGYKGTWNNAISTNKTGRYTYTFTPLQNQGYCASIPYEFTLYIFPLPPAFAGLDADIQKGIPYTLQASGGIKYLWKTGASLLSNPFVFNPVTTLQNTTLFTVEVTNQYKCKAVDSVLIKVYDGPTFYIPNAFTPNGDGRNDILSVKSIGTKLERFTIYNRWGQVIFSTSNSSIGWDGTFNGVKQPAGSYVWVLAGHKSDATPVQMKGMVTLIR